jgi:predicted ArsR family transcriptional regulator
VTGISKKLRKALSEGPGTVRELAEELKIEPRKVQIGMWILTHTGQATSLAKVANRQGGKCARTLKLYELTRRGELMQRKDRLR